jgi:hypothetical protein
MAFPFFHPEKPRQFNYEPRFYRPENDKDEQGNERTEGEKLAQKLDHAWGNRRSAQTRRGGNRSILILVAVVALIVLFISSKAFTRMFEVFGSKPENSGIVTDGQPQRWVVTDSTGRRDTLTQGNIGGIFADRIDSLAILAFRGEFGNDEQMQQALGNEYPIVKRRMDQLNEEYERTREQAQ